VGSSACSASIHNTPEEYVTEQRGFTLWLTGLSGSGKTALTKVVEWELRSRGLKVERLDGDIVRESLTKDLGFTKEDRDTNIERVTFVAKLLTRNGVAVLCSFISPYRQRRAKSRTEIGNFVECYVECPLEVCIERDVKGLYQRAIAGEIENFTGVSDPYELPENPEIVVHTAQQTIEESVAEIIRCLKELGYLESEEQEVYSEDDEAAVEERLRALGYI
jgi:adenylyl-sulfate kinase